MLDNGTVKKLLEETKVIQERLPINNVSLSFEKMFFKFKQLIETENVNGALQLLTI